MKLSATLPQFTNETALFVVTGKQEAEFYIARNGEIKLDSKVSVPVDRYSDREGFFARRGRNGKGAVSGAVQEENKEQHRKAFLKRLEEEFSKIAKRRKLAHVYLYAPEYLLPQAKTVVKKAAGDTYAMSFMGNYLKKRPTELVAMLESREERRAARRRIVPTKRDAQKLLRRENTA